ncbi:MAG: YncE family protein [Acidobacteria bacterium]|nr:YncE family protein [Acidobacteriota bacterium]
MNATQNLLRKILPASFLGLSLSSCAVLALLFAVSFSDVLLQVACEECFGVSPEGILVVNGTEGRTVEESVSPGLPPEIVVDQEPERSSYLAEVGLTCNDLFSLAELSFEGSSGAGQSLGSLRSGGVAVVTAEDAAARLGGQASAPARVYLTNSATNQVLAMDASTRRVLGAVTVGARPRGIAATPNGEKLFVANEDSGNVSVIETATLRELMRIPLPGDAEPFDIAITPDGQEAWVTSHETSGFVHILDTSLHAVLASVRVGRSPVQVAISPDGTLAYVTNEGDNRLSILDVWTRTVLRSLTVPSAYGVAFDPVGARVYVSSRSTPGRVRMLDVASDAELAAWDVGEKPEYLAVDGFATRLFVSNRLSDFLSVVNLLSGEVESTIPAPRGLGPVALVPATP